MTNLERTAETVEEFCKTTEYAEAIRTPDAIMLTAGLLADIAVSLSVIADALTTQEGKPNDNSIH